MLGTLAATGVSWTAVQSVSGVVVENQPAPLSSGTVSEQLKHPAAAPRPTEVPSPPPASPVEATEPPAANPPLSQSPSSASPPGPAPAAPPPPTPAPAATSRTFTLVGGSAQLSCTNGQIALNWATPNSGYWVETGTEDGGATIEVRFRSDAHESRLDASCSGSTVVGTIEEQSS